jgi:hypothetical protein
MTEATGLAVGQRVRVFPHGSPEQTAIGVITIISGNQRSIAVAFDHLPPFAFQRMPLVGVHPEHGIVLLAYREVLGPWIELAGGGHYEIEAALPV